MGYKPFPCTQASILPANYPYPGRVEDIKKLLKVWAGYEMGYQPFPGTRVFYPRIHMSYD